MQAELETILTQFGADTGTIHLLEKGVLVLEAHVGAPPPVVEIVSKVPIGKGMAGLAAERNDVVTTCNIQSDTSGDVRAGAKQTGVNAALVVPMRDDGGKVVGTLGIGVRRKYEYSQAETARLLEQASLLAKKVVMKHIQP